MSTESNGHDIGFIGAGNMATAMINGILKQQVVAPNRIFVSDTDIEKLSALMKDTQIVALSDNCQIAEKASLIILAVKPKLYPQVLEEIACFLVQDKVLISVAVGISTMFIRQIISDRCKVVRIMPNLASSVEEGMTAICSNHGLEQHEKNIVMKILSAIGKTEEVEEDLMDAVTAISGSSPAYVYMFIEALADGAVMMGLPREQAYRMAAQSVLGAAKMLIASNEHPGVLKDKVCTPGGTTIHGIYSMELNGFRGAVMDAMRTSALKAREMTK